MKIATLALFYAASACSQAVITDSGSTNRAGMSVTVAAKGHALIEAKNGTKMKMSMQSGMRSRFMQDLEAAGAIDQIQAFHCAKSTSFGSSMFVTYKGVRSPDLSCSGQTDPAVIALQKDMQEIMAQAHAKMPGQLRFR